jgi:hypothetical protein
MQRGDLVVERVDGQRERDVALLLGAAAFEDAHAGLPGARPQLAQQGALADSGLAHHNQRARGAVANLLDRELDGRELGLTREEPHTVTPVSSPACSFARSTFLSNLPTEVLGTSSMAT